MEYLLAEEYYFINNYKKNEIGKILNESCYVALDYYEELHDVKKYYYKLPDGKEINIKENRIKCPEILINPDIYLKNSPKENLSIVYNINNSIKKCDKDIQNELYKNILLTGRNSKLKGLKERVQKELKNLVRYSNISDVKVSYNEHEIEEGLKNFFANPVFEDLWLTREEYEERGIHGKFF